MAYIKKELENKARELATTSIYKSLCGHGAGAFSPSGWIDDHWKKFIPEAKKLLKVK